MQIHNEIIAPCGTLLIADKLSFCKHSAVLDGRIPARFLSMLFTRMHKSSYNLRFSDFRGLAQGLVQHSKFRTQLWQIQHKRVNALVKQ